MNIKIIVAAHKPYFMPDDDMYLPLQVGSFEKEGIGFARDDTGDNISEKNPRFCELTGIYWAWKNLDCDYIGLSHYRRHFCFKKKGDVNKSILKKDELTPLLSKCDVVLPKKRNYIIESLYSHYSNTHSEAHLKAFKSVLNDLCPEYLDEFEALKKRRSGHMFNMFIMKKNLADSYFSFIFPVLFELEKRVDIEKESDFNKRMFGRISELMLDMWLRKNNISYKEIPFIYTEKINLPLKIKKFLMAKFFKKSYDQSF